MQATSWTARPDIFHLQCQGSATLTHDTSFDIAIVGGGLVGLATAIALAESSALSHAKIALIAPREQPTDGRTTALLMPSIELLDKIGVWQNCITSAAPLKTMRMIDATSRLIRAPLTDFRSIEMGLDAFGYNVPNADLLTQLEARLKELPTITRFDARLSHVAWQGLKLLLTLSNAKTVEAGCVAAADGRYSMLRQSAGIKTTNWTYPQSALVTTFRHSLPHQSISTEFHTETGPFTQVPLPALPGTKNRSSLVWVEKPERAMALASKELPALAAMIEEKTQSCFGSVEMETKAQTFPLSGMSAQTFAQNGVYLLGEAAHVFPPIGAQGFNLGLRDVAAFVAVMSDAALADKESAYNRARRSDIVSSTAAVDLLNRSLLTDFLPTQAARAFTLTLASKSSWFRRTLMKHGLG